MMSLWDALRMNMMISYQELVRTFPNPCAVEMSEIIHELKDAAAQLMSKHSALPFYIKKFHIGFRFVPSTPEIISSAQKLNLIASIHEGKSKESTYEHIAEIGRMLKIPTTYSL
ncbi:hypothetical protein [Escherichia coli]|uniref:hypothetical protein n=1 Tax=Escherichia coli TaxID=562 RepID=UPI0020761C4E|nr:hypothetical protein [Escherichia coli]